MRHSHHPSRNQTNTTTTERARFEWAQFQTWISTQDEVAEAEVTAKLRAAERRLQEDLTKASRKEKLQLEAAFKQLEQSLREKVRNRKWEFAQNEWMRRLEKDHLKIDDWVACLEEDERAECEETLGIHLEEIVPTRPSTERVTMKEEFSTGINHPTFEFVSPDELSGPKPHVPPTTSATQPAYTTWAEEAGIQPKRTKNKPTSLPNSHPRYNDHPQMDGEDPRDHIAQVWDYCHRGEMADMERLYAEQDYETAIFTIRLRVLHDFWRKVAKETLDRVEERNFGVRPLGSGELKDIVKDHKKRIGELEKERDAARREASSAELKRMKAEFDSQNVPVEDWVVLFEKLLGPTSLHGRDHDGGYRTKSPQVDGPLKPIPKSMRSADATRILQPPVEKDPRLVRTNRQFFDKVFVKGAKDVAIEDTVHGSKHIPAHTGTKSQSRIPERYPHCTEAGPSVQQPGRRSHRLTGQDRLDSFEDISNQAVAGSIADGSEFKSIDEHHSAKRNGKETYSQAPHGILKHNTHARLPFEAASHEAGGSRLGKGKVPFDTWTPQPPGASEDRSHGSSEPEPRPIVKMTAEDVANPTSKRRDRHWDDWAWRALMERRVRFSESVASSNNASEESQNDQSYTTIPNRRPRAMSSSWHALENTEDSTNRPRENGKRQRIEEGKVKDSLDVYWPDYLESSE